MRECRSTCVLKECQDHYDNPHVSIKAGNYVLYHLYWSDKSKAPWNEVRPLKHNLLTKCNWVTS